MPTLHQTLYLQGLLEEVGERIKGYDQVRSYLSPDGQGFVLAVGGDRAETMRDFMMAVSQFLWKAQHTRSDRATAKQEVLRAFEEWLSKQKVDQEQRVRAR
jgi:hypothetical protein